MALIYCMLILMFSHLIRSLYQMDFLFPNERSSGRFCKSNEKEQPMGFLIFYIPLKTRLRQIAIQSFSPQYTGLERTTLKRNDLKRCWNF